MLTTKAGPFHPELAEPIRCVIVDDHEMLRQGLRAMLQKESDLEVCGACPDCDGCDCDDGEYDDA